ncbi:MAG: GGDEF domain-containing protein [Oceanobacter sp.]
MADLPMVMVASAEQDRIGQLSRILSRYYQLRSLGSSAQLKSWLHKPDDSVRLLIVDTDILNFSVHSLCQALAEHPNTRSGDVIILGENSPELEADALNSGAMAYLPLPMNERLIHARLMVVHEYRARLSALDGMSHIDGLTQVGNRRRFDESFETEWKWAARHNFWLGVLLIDADYFKRFNDEYGHLEGDRCLVMIAQALKDCTLRAHDLLARYGGEEFVAIVPAASQEGLAIVAERMMQGVQQLAIPHARSDVADTVSVSIGGACCRPGREQNRRDLLLAADEALYEVKHARRNNYRIQVTDESGKHEQ